MLSYRNPHHDPETGGHVPHRKEKSDYIILKVIQALNILEQFRDEVDELSLGELARRLSMNENSVRMLLATLKSRYYIEQDSTTENYRLGFKNLELAQTVLRQTDLYRVSHPVLASVSARCGENTAVAVLRRSHVIELDTIQSEHPVQVVSRVGDHLPVHCTAAGKAIIAAQGPEALAELFKRAELKSFTSNTMTSPEQLQRALADIVEQGYAVDDGELDRDVRAVAAAIHDFAGAVVGAVVVTGPCCRITLERIKGELAELVRDGANEISARLGFRPAGTHPPEASAAPRKPRGSRTRVRKAAAVTGEPAVPERAA